MPEDKDLRRARDRFGSLKTQLALNEAIAEVAGVTPFDADRIINQLDERRDEFKHIEGFKECRAAFVVWAVRQAQLTAKLRTILPELDIPEHIVSLVLLRLPNYTGEENRDDLKTWIVETAARESTNLYLLTEWVSAHRGDVRAGIRENLADCYGLGLDTAVSPVAGETRSFLKADGPWVLTVDEIESDVWLEVARDIEKVSEEVSAEGSTARLFNRKGFWAARSWRTNRLRERTEMSNKFFIGINGLEKITTDKSGKTERSDAAEGFSTLHSHYNPVIIHDEPWTQYDLERELRRAGPFRADGFDVIEPLAVAA